MFDDKIEQEQKSASAYHEMSETPFGVGQTESDAAAEAPAGQPGNGSGEEKESAQVEEPMTMEAAMAGGGPGVDYSGTFKSLVEGDVVDGVVVHIDREGVLVDVGTKSEGMIKPGELTRDPNLEPEDVVSVGDRIKVYVVQSEGHDGGPILSKKRADFENAWERVEKAFETGEVLKAMVTDRVKGGLVVDLGIRGFVPASHVGSGKLKNLEKYIGQSIQIKVIEVDRERRKVVLSNRDAVEEERGKMRKETLATLAEGQIREGVVRRITDYGAFVDLGGVDGLLHISEMSWTRINHPSEAVKVGQKLQVMVLKMNLGEGRVSLGLRQILPDPWEDVKRLHSVGEVIKGTVTRLVPFGAFVQVEGGVEGIIPNSELAVRRVNKPEEVVSVGQEVEIKVIDLRADERRMTLSLRQLQAQQERAKEEAEYKSYSTQSRSSETRTTIGDLIGEQLGDFGLAKTSEGKTEKKKSRAKSAKREAIEEAEALAEAEEMMAEDIEEPIVEEVKAEEPVEEPKAEEVKAEEPVEEPKAEEAKVEEPAEEPKTEEVKAEEPVEEPKAEEVKVEEPVEEPKAEEAKVEEPKAEEQA